MQGGYDKTELIYIKCSLHVKIDLKENQHYRHQHHKIKQLVIMVVLFYFQKLPRMTMLITRRVLQLGQCKGNYPRTNV